MTIFKLNDLVISRKLFKINENVLIIPIIKSLTLKKQSPN